MSDDDLHILRHSLGVRDDSSRPPFRNYYAADPDDAKLLALVAAGLMSLGARIPGGLQYFHVTDAGRAAVATAMPVSKPLTPGQRRYREFLTADCGETFIEWCKRYSRRRRVAREAMENG